MLRRLTSGVASALVAGALCAAVPLDPGGPPLTAPQPVGPAMRGVAVASADVFQLPLPSWTLHCLGFGSQWRYCNGTPLRVCSGRVWLHTGVDITTGIQPVMAAGDGVIVGYQVDPMFRGGVLIRHRTSFGVVLTQYWHVWLRPGFRPGVRVKRGQAFADVASMGDKTHLHFAVFMGDYEPHAWNGALPLGRCDGFPAFPYKFLDPTAFIEAHQPPVVLARGVQL